MKLYLHTCDIPTPDSGLPVFVLIISGVSVPMIQLTENVGALQGCLCSDEVTKYMEGRFNLNGGGKPCKLFSMRPTIALQNKNH